MFLYACPQVRGANFLFSLKQEDQSNGWSSAQCGICLHDFEREKEIPLIITCSSRIHSTIPDRWFEWWGSPLIEWVGWLYIIVSIEQEGRCPRFFRGPCTIYHRMPLSRQYLDRWYTC